jgi:hypothetical protein
VHLTSGQRPLYGTASPIAADSAAAQREGGWHAFGLRARRLNPRETKATSSSGVDQGI